MPDNELVGLQHIAQVCGVSRATVDRRRGDLERRGAYKLNGQWHVPVAALIEVGLHPDASRDNGDASQVPHPAETVTSHDASRERITELEVRVRILEAEVDKWCSIATERERGLEDFRRNQRLLEARLPAQAEDAVPTTAAEESKQEDDDPQPSLFEQSRPPLFPWGRSRRRGSRGR